MTDLCYYNGAYGAIDEMMVPLNDRSYYFGDALYEAIYAQNHIPFAIEDHLDRMYGSFEEMRMHVTISKDELRDIIQNIVGQVDSNEQMVYIQLSRGTYRRQHSFPPENIPCNLLVYSNHHPLRDISVSHNLVTVEDTRWTHCNLKTPNLLPNVWAMQKAKEMGCSEAVFHRGNIVTECSAATIFIVQDHTLRTAPNSNLILPGTTRAHFLRIANELGVSTCEEAFTLEELFSADEVFFTGCTAHCVRVGQIDGRPVGGKDPGMIKRLQEAYRSWLNHICGELKR